MENEHHHEHHDHDGMEAEGHVHLQHNGHFDEGAIDLMICLLEDVAHSKKNDDCHCVPTIENASSSDWTAKLRMLAVIVPFAVVSDTNCKKAYHVSPSSVLVNRPVLSELPQRGPPSIS